MLLHVCEVCKEYVIDRQVTRVQASMEAEIKDTGVEVLSKAFELNASLVNLEDKIAVQLTMVNILHLFRFLVA